MWNIRPGWLGHFDEGGLRQPIYSLDVSPDGARLATGGLDGKVRVWSVPACLNSSDENEAETGLLSTMPAHTGGVLSVRFSPNGRWLASGSDDKMLIIWERDERSVAPKMSYGETDVVKEVWKVYRRLVGHENDIVDLGWSYDSSLLVSVGLDSNVIVWSGSTYEKIKTLSHASSVKGVTFDPAGKYFATESDDRTIKVWRISDYVCEATISTPFVSSPISTYFRRPSWSPDGSHIGGANAMNGRVSAAAIINRGTWTSEISLIGHEGAVEVVKFNPVLFQRADTEDVLTVIACAGQDRVLSIWNTTRSRPITTVADVAEQSTSDLAWTPDGLSLFICSFDGSITLLRFEEAEFGKAQGSDVNESVLSKYGAGRQGDILPESVEQLALEDRSRHAEEESKQERLADLMGTSAHEAALAMRTLPLEKPVEAVVVAEDSAINHTEGTAMATTTVTAPSAPTSPVRPYVQKVTMVNGKKRIQPQLISSGPAQSPSISRHNAPPQTSMIHQHQLEISQPSLALPRGGLPTLIAGNKRSAESQDDMPSAKRIADGSVGDPRDAPEFMRPAAVNPAATTAAVRLGIPKIQSLVSHINTIGIQYVFEARNPAKETSQDPVRVSFVRKGRVAWIDYIQSPVVLLIGTDHYVAAACEDGGLLIWTLSGRRFLSELVLEAAPAFLEGCETFLMTISAIGMLRVWDLRERKALFAPVSLAPILDAASSVYDKLTRGASITQAGITDQGIPIITLSNGDGCIYDKDLFSFVKLSESWWAVSSNYWDGTTVPRSAGGSTWNGASDTHAANGTARTAVSGGILGALERKTNDELMRQGRGRLLGRIVKQALTREGFEGLETAASIAHLENRLAAALLLRSQDEYREALMLYARRIAAEDGYLARVEELCRELMGPPVELEAAAAASWEPHVLGLEKRTLLRECLIQMGKFRGCQRVTTQFSEQLDRLASLSAM
ncbi:TUP1-like enhancer of split-domain-containing protein [Protomyces lactucae-debilis]|uniref:Protein HIR n=1 Tax=Protomyces lactucae-debilis TaxID=2754530 RepID=A0A1Y2FDS1_PROLT|nr:TUP1-like enhancer of split-domain-containing protein [Protomyces lactucae-debilis]ORY80995.1 TUP1-like enhancer of split-domain-containing protein [Protomyces lactucae-debilis]